jgi:hypothetical protein
MSKKKRKNPARSPRQTGGAGRRRRPTGGLVERGEPGRLVETMESRLETGPRLTGGDLDADWQRAGSSGDEAVGGSVATPDQDVVDEIGRALGVERPADAEFVPSEEILRQRDRLRWRLEREADETEEAGDEQG